MNSFFKIISILDKKEKKTFFMIILLSFFNSILDLLSIGFIYPLTASILKINNNTIIEKFNALIVNNLNINIIIFYLTLIILLFILRNIFNILFFILLNNFLKKNFNKNTELSLKHHLNIDFQEFITQTYAKFYNNIVTENNNLKYYISTTINLFSEILLIISLICLVFIFNTRILKIYNYSTFGKVEPNPYIDLIYNSFIYFGRLIRLPNCADFFNIYAFSAPYYMCRIWLYVSCLWLIFF